MNNVKLKVGDKLYNSLGKEYEITKVGTRFYYLGIIQVHKDNLRAKDNYTRLFYIDEKEAIESKERNTLEQQILSLINRNGTLSKKGIEDLRNIVKILTNET